MNLMTVDIAYMQIVVQFAHTLVVRTVRSSWILTDSEQPTCSSQISRDLRLTHNYSSLLICVVRSFQCYKEKCLFHSVTIVTVM